MKRILCSLILAAAAVQAVFSDSVLEETPIEYEKIYTEYSKDVPGKSILNQEELEADVKNLVYILENGYSGYEDMVSLGFDSEEMIQQVLENFAGQEEIPGRAVYREYIRLLEPYIQDSHFAMIYQFENRVLVKHKTVKWTGTFVKKSSAGNYAVSETDSEELSVNDEYTGSDEDLFYYPAKGKNVYRLGYFSSSNQPEKKYQFQGKTVSLKLTDDNAIAVHNNLKYREIETKNTGYVCITNFVNPPENDSRFKGSRIIFKKYSDIGRRWHDKKTIILDLRGNCGGFSNNAGSIYAGLYDKNFISLTEENDERIEYWNRYLSSGYLISSPVFNTVSLDNQIAHGGDVSSAERALEISKKEPVRRKVRIDGEQLKLSCRKPWFKGNIIILADRNTLSAGEWSLIYARELFQNSNQVTVIGENTNGALTYVWNNRVVLPYTGIPINLAFFKAEIEKPYWLGEGLGIVPDWWAASEDLNESIFLISKDMEMKQKLAGIERDLK